MAARTYYAVLTREIHRDGVTFRAGHVVMTRKRENIEGLVDVWSAPIQRGALFKVALTAHQCRELFTAPTLDLDSAMEASFMVSESVYC